jgi:hypothetical protein
MLAADRKLRDLYQKDTETRRARRSMAGDGLERRHAPDLLKRIRQTTGHDISLVDLDRFALSGAIRYAVARRFEVRERDLH